MRIGAPVRTTLLTTSTQGSRSKGATYVDIRLTQKLSRLHTHKKEEEEAVMGQVYLQKHNGAKSV
jgi:hypothetical protein